MDNITAAKPFEIDAQLAALHGAYAIAQHRYDARVAGLQRHAGLTERPAYRWGGKPRWVDADGRTPVGEEIVKLAQAELDAGRGQPWDRRSIEGSLRDAHDAAQLMARAEAEMAPFNAEFARRGGWTRFFTVPAGHIHQSTNCSTCNKGQYRTQFGWNPELSGLTEAEAVAKLGPTLCSVCFPSAPVEWRLEPAQIKAAKDAETHCTEKRALPSTDGTPNWQRRWGKCSACGEGASITSSGNLRKHKRPATAKV